MVSLNQSMTFDEGLRTFFYNIYKQMFFGILATSFVSMVVATYLPFLVTGITGIVMALIPLVFVLVLTFGIEKLSYEQAQVVFYTYCASVGVSLASIFLLFTGESIARALFVSSSVFGVAALYGYTTKRDLTSVGSFLVVGLIALCIASLVNLFLQSSMLQWVLSVISVIIFTGLTAWDNQRLKDEYFSYADVHDSKALAKASLMGSLGLYLNFLNLFIALVQLLGNRKD